jgi:hypothetical protein
MIRTTFYCLLFLASVSFGYSQNLNSIDILFKNVNIITMTQDEVLKNHQIGISNGKIVFIGQKIDKKTIVKKTIDLKNQYIMPSLADAHIHLPEKEEDLKRFFELNIINGVTKLRSMRGDWKHKEWKEKYNTKDTYFPSLYLSAPPISRNYEANIQEIEQFIKSTKERGFGFVKILSIKSQKIFQQIDSLSKKYNIPLGGHFPRLASGNNLNEDVFFNSNYKSIEHLGGLIGEPNFLDSRIDKIKKNSIFICPTLSWYSIGSGQYSYDELQKLSGMEYVSKANMQEWLDKTKLYREKLGEQAYKEEVVKELNDLKEKYLVVNRLQKEGVKMLLSPDGNAKYMIAGFNMITEMELLKNANLSNYEILQMATINFAQFYSENNGVLAVGKEADFIVLNENPLEKISTLKQIKALYFNNQFLDSEKLNQIRNNIVSNLNN